ncbi:MAG: glycosyltransferase [Cellvibrionales bacterium]|mgnify:CR=1 FL=1|jgi:GT2 family glycosyltransferase/glycosyltransferase involved in cell wall biosynthesis|nr:glycosyltransferase [Cellvibrionales bacterium]MBK8675561.1 glycosyltransferase [Cellvibrionales bacterium]
MIDVIVPVYDGLEETRRCIESVLSGSNVAKFNVLVVDDCSPNAEIKKYLEKLAAEEKIELHTNKTNKGFVGTVNLGMRLHADRDVVLLNSDTEVANDWLDRMLAHAAKDERIATITPFSNNAEICSFPRYCQPNSLFLGKTVAEIDAVFAGLPAEQIDVPTGVGFCMYIRRDAINDVGLFDEEAFGRGYGEENDFCMRVSAAGWRNVTCSNVFVFHDGGVSFSSEKAERVQNAMAILDKKYPSYHRLVQEHLKKDPERPFRVMAQLALMRQSRKPKYLFVTHSLGGGVVKHLHELAEHVVEQVECLFLRSSEEGFVEVGCHYGDYHWSLFFNLHDEYARLLEFLQSIEIERVHLHHVMNISDDVLDLVDDLSVPFDVTLHDYYFVSANPTLTDRHGVFAEDPVTRDTLCAESYPLPHQMNVAEWRSKFSEILLRADRVFSPSQRCREVYLEYFPQLAIEVAYHPEWEQSHPYAHPRVPEMTAQEQLRILVIGAMSREKGADVLERTATYRDALNRLQYHLIGYAYKPLAPEVVQHGAYDDEKLDDLIKTLKPHLVWFPAQWHETYCYTLSAALRSGLPILATDLGSFPERLEGRPLSFIKPWRSTPIEWNDTLLQIRDLLIGCAENKSAALEWHQASPENCAFLYGRDYVVTLAEDKAPSVIPSLPSLRQVMRWCYAPPANRTLDVQAREKILLGLMHCREKYGVRHILKLVPFAWQRKVKRWFSHRPLHEVINDQASS